MSDNKIDKLSQWLKETVQGGSKAKSVSSFAEQPFHKQAPKKKNKGHGKNPASKKPSNSGHQKKGGGRKVNRPQGGPQAVRKKNIQSKRNTSVKKGVMRIIPIGGLEEVGKNAMVIEYENDIIVIDMGFQFPEDDMLGVDYVIPDIQYLVERKDRIRGILITHGHLDHIGAIPYVIPDLGFPPIYGMPLSIGLVNKQLKEHKLTNETTVKVITNKDKYRFGKLEVEFFRVNHSIPDSIGIVVRSPEGTIVHTGDFKFDFTPADGIEADIGKMSEIGKRGVHMMFSDSTNATKPGHTMSERVVADNLEKAITDAKGRIIIACFASLVGRIQQIIEFAEKEGRKVFLSGRSIEHNTELGRELGFIKAPSGLINSIRQVGDCPPEKTLILTTGSQGEPMAALSRMATNCHAQVQIRKGDTVVLSASPIIGNEKSVAFLVDNLARLGATIVHNRIMDVHTSGHGQQEDLKMMMALIKPDHLVPVHGNFYMRRAHGSLGPKVGIPEERVHMMDNGNVIELRGGKVSFKQEDIGVKYVVVDGHGRGDLGSQVLKDREMMAENGVVYITMKMRKGKLVGMPHVETKGFIYKEEVHKTLGDIEKHVQKTVQKLSKNGKPLSAKDIELRVKSDVSGLILRKLNRRPLVSTKVMHI